MKPKNSTRLLASAFVICFSFLSTSAWAVSPDVTVAKARATLVVDPPTLDGRLDDPVWQSIEPLKPLTQVVPVTGATPSQATEIRIVRTQGALYVGIRCFDTHPDEIIARVMKEDGSLRGDDRVGFFLDTFRDHRSSYFFGVNPNGSRFDALVSYKSFKSDWDTIWRARGRIDELGWLA